MISDFVMFNYVGKFNIFPRNIFERDHEKRTPRVYRSVTLLVIYKCRFDAALFMNRWIAMYGRIILRILTGWGLMKSAFSAVESKRKRVTLVRNFIARDFLV